MGDLYKGRREFESENTRKRLSGIVEMPRRSFCDAEALEEIRSLEEPCHS